jgi:hypothetical protein
MVPSSYSPFKKSTLVSSGSLQCCALWSTNLSFNRLSVRRCYLRPLSTNSSLPIATAYAAYNFGEAQIGVVNIELPMKAAFYDGIFYQNVSTTATALSPTCSTGKCTFEQYSSLFVCSRCVDVTSLIQSSPTRRSIGPGLCHCLQIWWLPLCIALAIDNHLPPPPLLPIIVPQCW